MGVYYSLTSIFSSTTESNHINVQSNSKSKKRRRRRHKQNNLLNRFFLGSKYFFINTQPNTCIFNDYYYSNTKKDVVNPVHLQISLPESNQSTVIRPVQCTIAIRRDSLKLIHCYDDYYSLDFTFDADRAVQISSMFTFCIAKFTFYESFSLIFQSILWLMKSIQVIMDRYRIFLVKNQVI